MWGLTVTQVYKVGKCDLPRVSQVSRQICLVENKDAGLQEEGEKEEGGRGRWQRERWIRNELGKVSHWFLHHTEE